MCRAPPGGASPLSVPTQLLHEAADALGLMLSASTLYRFLYMDNAKIYRGQQLARTAASIGILVVHTPHSNRFRCCSTSIWTLRTT